MTEQSDESDETSDSTHRTGPPVLTERLLLRLPEPGDAEDFVAAANNMNIASQMSGLPHPYSLKNAESWIVATRARSDKRRISMVMTLRSDDTLVGATGVGLNENEDLEINYFVAESHWGSGLATEAAQAIVDHAFATLGIDRIVGRCRVANGGSRRVLEKCGFQYTGAGLCNCAALNGAFASEEFALERSVWTSLKRWGRAS